MVLDETTSPSLTQAAKFLDDGHIDQALAVYHALIAMGGEDKMSALFGVATVLCAPQTMGRGRGSPQSDHSACPQLRGSIRLSWCGTP